jgi:adenylate kinase family enzyme
MKRYNAILLLGPTGSGKTPLGELLEKTGLDNQKCFHFDFGVQLRKIGAKLKTSNCHCELRRKSERGNLFTKSDIKYIKSVLQTGALLDNKHFYIAKKVLLSFIKGKRIKENDLIILNGLPRHIGQAKGINGIINVGKVIYLSCSAKVVCERIKQNSGGDRTERVDDYRKSILNKLEIFEHQTKPLLKYYKSKKSELTRIKVCTTSKAMDTKKILTTET